MKNFLFLVFLFLIVSGLAGFSQTKIDSLHCPAGYQCIQIDLNTETLIEGIQVDKPIIIYGDYKNNEITNGLFIVYEKISKNKFDRELKVEKLKNINQNLSKLKKDFNTKNEDIYLKIFEQGILNFSGNMFYAKIEKFPRRNKQYFFRLSNDFYITEEGKKTIVQTIINFYNGINDEANAKGLITYEEILKQRKKTINSLPDSLSKYMNIERFIANGKNDVVEINILDKIANKRNYIENINNKAKQNAKKIKKLITDNYNILKVKYSSSDSTTFSNLKFTPIDCFNLAKGKIGFETTTVLPDLLISSENNELQKYLNEINNSILVFEVINMIINKPNTTTEIDSIILDFNSVKDKLGYLMTTNSEISNYVNEINLELYKKVVESREITGSSSGNLVTSGNWYVNPDIGAFTSNFKSNYNAFNNDARFVIPYLGMSLYFAPMSTDVPIRKLKEEYPFGFIFKILSLHFGVSIPKIKADGYKGIFLDNSSDSNGFLNRSFIAGIGLRPWRAVKLSTGYMFINRQNSYALNTNYTLSGRPYFSISLDWKLRNLIPDIKDIFKTKS